jgi:hypothetical protein
MEWIKPNGTKGSLPAIGERCLIYDHRDRDMHLAYYKGEGQWEKSNEFRIWSDEVLYWIPYKDIAVPVDIEYSNEKIIIVGNNKGALWK